MFCTVAQRREIRQLVVSVQLTCFSTLLLLLLLLLLLPPAPCLHLFARPTNKPSSICPLKIPKKIPWKVGRATLLSFDWTCRTVFRNERPFADDGRKRPTRWPKRSRSSSRM